MIFSFQQRFCHKTINWRIVSERQDLLLMSGTSVDGPVDVADVNDRPDEEVELLDFQGNAMQGLATEKMKRVLEELDPGHAFHRSVPAQLTNRPDPGTELFIVTFTPREFTRDIFDRDACRIHLDEEGSIIDIIDLRFTADFIEKTKGTNFIFGTPELEPIRMFVTEAAARKLDEAGLTGFKLFSMEAYFDDIRYRDPYLNPDRPQFETLGQESRWLRPDSIIDCTGPGKAHKIWDPENEYVDWDELDFDEV